MKKPRQTTSVRRKVSDAAPARPTDDPAAPPLDQCIRLRAYELYQARGGAPSHDLGDWLLAESELKAGQAQSPPQL